MFATSANFHIPFVDICPILNQDNVPIAFVRLFQCCCSHCPTLKKLGLYNDFDNAASARHHP